MLSFRQSVFDRVIPHQLLSITNEILVAFDQYPTRETRAVSLDISKAFDKVWHEGLIGKLKSNGIQGKVLNLIISFLSNRQQRVVLNGKSSEWKYVKARLSSRLCARTVIFSCLLSMTLLRVWFLLQGCLQTIPLCSLSCTMNKSQSIS